ncbi:Ig-like domain-containing protein [Sulfuricurvum sp.]|uniref:Ig-like domain-containing protein n=1 Tax=Sulfuricurvum sp. TaxID=2025608 RepID=UPI002620E840|nr:Ig-like domain-containing protein [Sulfuricurvum sp.]MDD3597349.1 Ig-like domain-containing protein [Sulfuricurvum sp.]
MTFHYGTSDVTATDGADYSGVSGVGTISAGTLTTTITVPIHSDAVPESPETFEVVLSNPSANAEIADGTGIGTILDGARPADDTASVTEGALTITESDFSNLLANDQVAAGSTITSFTYKDESNVTQTGTVGVAVDTLYGTLTVNADGTWSYTSDAQENHPAGNGALSETIVYTVEDGYGNSGTANFVIAVTDTVPTALIDATLTLAEGGNTVTSDGSDSAHDNLLTNDTLGADGAAVTSITYINESNVSTTVAVPAGGSGISVDTLYGMLNVKSDGSWSFTSDSSVDNTLGDVTDTFSYTITDSDGDTSSATKSFTITDGPNPDFAPNDQSVSEVDLGYGVTLTPVTVHESLGIIPGSDAYTAKFAATQSSLEALNLSAGGVALTYTVTDGVITAKAGTTTVFTVTLTNPSASNAGYDFKLYTPIDHVQPTNDTQWNLPFDVYVEDSDGDVSATKTFDVTVIDSVPSNADQAVTLTEDAAGGKIIRLSQDNFESNITLNNGHDGDQSVATGGSIDIYDGASVIGTLTNLGDGTVRFDPLPNYSNYNGSSSAFTYTITDEDGDSASATVTLSVTPVADAPTMQADQTVYTYEDSSWDGAAYSGDITKAIALGLEIPVKNDQADQNTGTGDAPERLSVLTFNFSGSSDFGTATIGYDTDGDGTLDGVLTTITKNSTFTIDITDVSDYHPTSTNGTYHLTQAQYESLAIIPADDNATNIKFTIKTASHEVDDSGAVFGTDIVSSTQTQNVTVDVKAVTDPISLSFDSDQGLGMISTTTNGNDTFTYNSGVLEGIGAIDLQALLSHTSGTSIASVGDLDGSEHRTYTVSGIPEGTIITLGGTSAIANASGVATVNFSNTSNTDEDPAFTMTLPPHYSGTVNATITLSVKDTDADSTVTPLTNTQTVYFNITVDPVANDVTLAVKQAVGLEDAGRLHGNDTSVGAATIDAPANAIALNIKTTSADTDGSETFTVSIDKIPDGGSLYVYDSSSTTWKLVDNTDIGTDGNITVSSNGDGTWKITIADYQNDHLTKFVPPHNNDDNYVFDVAAYTVDGAEHGITQTLQMNVDVIGVADIPVNTDLNTLTVSGHTVNYTSSEEALDSSGNSFELKEVYQTPLTLSSYDSDGSESLTIVVTGLDEGFALEGATFMGGSGETRQWSFTQAQLADGTVKMSTPVDFSGTMTFDVKYITTESEGNSKTSDTVPVNIYVTPYADSTIVSSTAISEDVKSQVDFGFVPHDSNEALSSLKINIADVGNSADFTLYYGNTDTKLADAVGNGHVTSDGTYYILDATAAANIYALGAADKNGSYTFEVKYTITDTENDFGAVDTQEKTIAAYALDVVAVTDVPNIAAGTIADAPGHTASGSTVVVTDHTTITVPFTVTSHDTDGSENVQYYIVRDVPEGVEVQGGLYAGHVGTMDSGVWYVPVTGSGILGAGGYSQDIIFVVNGGADFQTRDVTISAYTQDADGAAVENGSTQITIVRDDTYIADGTGGNPATFSLSAKALDVFEDQPFNLASAFEVTQSGAVTSGSYAITVTDLPDGATITGYTNSYESGGKTYYVIVGNGNAADANDALSHVIITPAQDVNNHDGSSANAMTLSATLTTYAGSVYSSSDSVLFSEPIYPVTDTMNIVTTGGTTTEDPSNAYAFSVVLNNDSDGVNTQIIDGKLYLKVTENYTDSGESATGTLYDSFGTPMSTSSVSGIGGLSDGEYYVIDVSGYTLGETLSFQYMPGENRQGTVSIDTYVLNQESQGWGGGYPAPGDTQILVSHSSSTITVSAVVDGINGGGNLSGTASEDAFAGGLNRVEITTPSLIDPSEAIQSAVLDGIPVGFLVYYGADDASLALAQNAGTSMAYTGTFDLSGTDVGYNQWVIPLSGGALPAKIYIQAPANWSGTISDAQLKLYISDNGSAVMETINMVNVTIDPVSDAVTLNATKTFGNQYSPVALNLNANVVDVDGSERATIVLVAASATQLSADAWFTIERSDGSIENVNATYDTGTSSWTLNDVNSSDLGNIKIYHPTYSGDIDVSVTMTDGTAAEGAAAIDTFNLALGSTTQTSTIGTESADTIDVGTGSDMVSSLGGNDTIIVNIDSTDVINAGSGTDTLIFSNTGNIDLSGVANIMNVEKIDLSGNGNQTLSGLSMDQIFNMSDASGNSRTLTIDGDAGDVLGAVNKGSWSEASETVNGNYTDHVYTKDGGYTLTLKVETVITDNSGL